MKLFAVIRTRGAAWNASAPLEGQADWQGHRGFMNALVMEGFVVLGGPLEDGADVLLVIRAESQAGIMDRLAADPWSKHDLLRLTRIAPWDVRLGRVE